MSKSRFEAFTDGVFAIAITLLVLEIHIPDLQQATDGDMITWIRGLAPSLLTFVLSFATIGVIWINHHAAFMRIRHVDRTGNLLNLLLLLTVCFVPYPTALLARYGPLPASTALYGISFFLMGASYGALLLYSNWYQRQVDPTALTLSWPRRIRGTIGSLIYLFGACIAFWVPKVSVGLYVLVTLYYVIPERSDRIQSNVTP